MDNLSTFLFIFIGILVVAGWISAEMITSKSARTTKKANVRAAKLEKENNQLTHEMAREQDRYKKLKAEYDKAREAKDQIREFEKEYKRLVRAYNKFSEGIDSLKNLVSAKKYKNNILSREVIEHMNEHLPTEAQMANMKEESTKEVFKRIKKRMEGEPD